jgi:hypothetical protein
MIHIKKFIDKISAMESKQNKDVVIPMLEARGLRDEIAKLLADLHNNKSMDVEKVDFSVNPQSVVIKGGTFK